MTCHFKQSIRSVRINTANGHAKYSRWSQKIQHLVIQITAFGRVTFHRSVIKSIHDDAIYIVESVEKGERLFHPYHNQGYYYCGDDIYLYTRKLINNPLTFGAEGCCTF